MREKSIFGEIIISSSKHPENEATKALHYLLNQYPSAWVTLLRFFKPAGVNLPEKLYFKLQVKSETEDNSIPDIVGSDNEGAEILILESKFWAGLTANQPVEYLKRLQKNKESLMVVIAPSARFETLWAKLKSACNNVGLELMDIKEITQDFRCVKTSIGPTLCLISWRVLLGALEIDAHTNNEQKLMSDVLQLSGLCASMDSQAFLPIHPDELSPMIGRRVQQYVDLVDEVVAVIKSKHGGSTEKLKTGGKQSTYGRFFKLNDYEGLAFFLSYKPNLWAFHWETPIWLIVYDTSKGKWLSTPQLVEALSQKFFEEPGRVIPELYGVNVGIDLITGVEKQEIISEIVNQVLGIAESCK